LVLGAGALLLLALLATLPTAAENAPGIEQCAGCHEEQAAKFKHNRHAVLDSKGLAAKARQPYSCVSCHGDAAKHLEQGGGKGTIFAFAKTEPANAKNKACLACHADNHGGYYASPHAKAAMDCTACHAVHTEDGKGAHDSGCATCHADVAAKFKLNERHRLKEGILQCTTCHNPHEAAGRERLGGFKNEECFTCHTDKQGPFVYEHGAGTFEGCTACHDPHGSPNRHMLTFQNTTDLCYSCHAAQPTFHSRFTKDTRCTNCHYTIHGSNLSAVFLK